MIYSSILIDTLRQLRYGSVTDENLVSKEARTTLLNKGFVIRDEYGRNYITIHGIKELNMIFNNCKYFVTIITPNAEFQEVSMEEYISLQKRTCFGSTHEDKNIPRNFSGNCLSGYVQYPKNKIVQSKHDKEESCKRLVAAMLFWKSRDYKVEYCAASYFVREMFYDVYNTIETRRFERLP